MQAVVYTKIHIRNLAWFWYTVISNFPRYKAMGTMRLFHLKPTDPHGEHLKTLTVNAVRWTSKIMRDPNLNP